ncbi:MAG: RNA 2',3'-cyclic phosphodiesterase [Pirellulales bacterium]
MSTIRTFIAIETPPEIHRRIADLMNRLRRADADVKWVAPEQMHWTIKFLGNVDDHEIHEVCRAVEDCVEPFTPFDLTVSGVGAFPTPDRPRTLWIGATNGAEALGILAGSVEKALAQLGYPKEHRRFTAHLTLGRVHTGRNAQALAQLLKENAEFDAGTMGVDEVVVFSSRLEPEGAVHEALGRAPLMG